MVGLFALVGSYEEALQAANRSDDEVMVIVAARDLYQGVPVTEADLYAVQMPTRYLPTGVFLSPEHVVGRIPRERILANELVRGARLSNPEEGSGLNGVIPRGLRAVSVDIGDGAALSGFLQPGSYVDVLVTLQSDSGQAHGSPQTRTALQAVFVLGVNGRLAKGEATQRSARSSVTLLLSPARAEQLTHAQILGELVLSLRPNDDVEPIELRGVDACDLVECPEATVAPVRQRADPCRSGVLRMVHGDQIADRPVRADGTPCD